jgi:alkanesulfonate monooxygenase SsuD/methylene tetrahydromethanopterin reductase-like flavin-dependent oxidoreductase (luciferase family)
MKVAVTLPSMLHGVEPNLIYDWARLADGGPFSALGTGELITTPSYDALTVLMAVGAVTTRVRLMTSVLVVPLHREGLLAKQTATIDRLTGGRLTLGVGIGGKKPILFGYTGDDQAHSNYPDFEAAPAPYEGRARRFDEQIAYMRRIWAGESPVAGVPPVGPRPARPGGPELLIGGFNRNAIARAARLADGLTIFDHGADAAKVAGDFELARQGWRELGRAGEPRLVASTYFALGPDAPGGKQRFLDTHYAHLTAEGKARIGDAIRLTSDDAVRQSLKQFESIGADEVLLVPTIPSLDQVHRLADLV